MSLALRNAVGEALSATSGSEKSRLAASPPTLDKWIPRSARKQSILDETLAMDQEENEFRLSAFRGRPVALTFYYTRCDNPNKCSVAVTRMAELRQSLDSRGMRSSVLLALVTYDPDFDSPQRMLRFAESRGGKLDQHMLSLRLSDVAAVERFVDAMGAAASFGRGHVAAHSADLILLDREGRVASTHRGMSWDVSRVADDLRRLARE
jgi:protein SCO1/2